MQFRDGVASPAKTTPATLARMAAAVEIDPEELLTAMGMPLDVLDQLELHEGGTGYSDKPPASKDRAKILDISRFTPHEQDLIEAFLFGLESGRKRSR
ncbi:Uncharacterised protein [Mycobacteroides abscessus subsp. abscessus]|nr:Uncharacterised protein [Mycobacteroides abscessus subsp. abscessus]